MSTIIGVVGTDKKLAFYHQECHTPAKGDIVYGVLRLRESTKCPTCKEIIRAGLHLQDESEEVAIQLTLF